MKKILSVILFSAFLQACGPVYGTRYSFSPPADPQSRLCIAQCDNTKFQCRLMEDNKVQNCELRAQLDYSNCRSRYADHKKADDNCFESYCSSADYDGCEQNFRSCYQVCGGVVTAETVCEAFCG